MPNNPIPASASVPFNMSRLVVRLVIVFITFSVHYATPDVGQGECRPWETSHGRNAALFAARLLVGDLGGVLLLLRGLALRRLAVVTTGTGVSRGDRDLDATAEPA